MLCMSSYVLGRESPTQISCRRIDRSTPAREINTNRGKTESRRDQIDSVFSQVGK